jgi:hypothetical protein
MVIIEIKISLNGTFRSILMINKLNVIDASFWVVCSKNKLQSSDAICSLTKFVLVKDIYSSFREKSRTKLKLKTLWYSFKKCHATLELSRRESGDTYSRYLLGRKNSEGHLWLYWLTFWCVGRSLQLDILRIPEGHQRYGHYERQIDHFPCRFALLHHHHHKDRSSNCRR